MRSPINIVDVDRTETWSHYKAGMCDTCMANCCTMPLEVRLTDLVRLGVVERFHQKSGIFTMARRADGDCRYLDAHTRRCTVYAQRPDTCRKHPQVGPRPGHCPYGRRDATR